jgi:hypothetical protein
VSGMCALTLIVQKGLTTFGAMMSVMSALEEGAPVRAAEEEDVPLVDVVAALGFGNGRGGR